MKVRIGIDVGGTFTDAVVIDNDTYELVAWEKIPTTHTSEKGVAAGIIEVLERIMGKYEIKPEDVIFIAHGTTQATNALLEGDVEKVGVITLGSGLEGLKSKSDTSIGNIRLTGEKNLLTSNRYIDLKKAENLQAEISKAIRELKEEGCNALVAAEAFSVDDPENENMVVEVAQNEEIPATATNDISKLYGLKVRTRTAVVNASIMPKMLEAANQTARGAKGAGIDTKLMVMRCDGGVMTIDEVRRRPILTILSGPAAGVAGALMYEKLTDGLFFEVGGTSTDISCVKDGKVIIKYAQIGGHKTYLNSLDVRTVGIGGGSMIQVTDGKITDTGPRSAHIAELDYEVYAKPEEIEKPVLKSVKPTPGDPEYACIECANGKRFALTLSGAANIAGLISSDDYAWGNVEAARKAWQPLAEKMGLTVEETAEKALHFAAGKIRAVVRELMNDYGMDPRTTVFVGGGGGASTIVPYLGKVMNHKTKIARNASVISTIGVALALVRDTVERMIVNPTEKDILAVRREAEVKVMAAGAIPSTIEVIVEVDPKRHLVRATAVGSTEFRSKASDTQRLTIEEMKAVVAENLLVDKDEIYLAAENGFLYAMMFKEVQKKLFGVFKKTSLHLRLIDDEGVIRLQKSNAHVKGATAKNWEREFRTLIEGDIVYGDGGEEYPGAYIVYGSRIITLTGLSSIDHMISVAKIELTGLGEEEKLILISSKI